MDVYLLSLPVPAHSCIQTTDVRAGWFPDSFRVCNRKFVNAFDSALCMMSARVVVALLLSTCAAAGQRPDKVFFIGSGSTGTRTLSNLMIGAGYRTVHYLCPPDLSSGVSQSRRWFHHTVNHDARSRCLADHDAFLDNGDKADVAWLLDRYPNARFVLNVRQMEPWMISRLDHERHDRRHVTRLRQNCAHLSSPERASRCEEDVLRRARQGEFRQPIDAVTDNVTLAQWIVRMGSYQQQVLGLFNSTLGRRQRFVLVDVVRMSQCDVLRLLGWVARDDWRARPTSRLVLAPHDVPRCHAPRGGGSCSELLPTDGSTSSCEAPPTTERTQPAPSSSSAPSSLPDVHASTPDRHISSTLTRMTGLLEEVGCAADPEALDELVFVKCPLAICASQMATLGDLPRDCEEFRSFVRSDGSPVPRVAADHRRLRRPSNRSKQRHRQSRALRAVTADSSR